MHKVPSSRLDLRRQAWRLVWAFCLVIAPGWLGCVVRPRFESDVQTAVAQADMRRMETDELIVYYPEAARNTARRIAARTEQCTSILRKAARIHSSWADQKLRIVVADLPMNNAGVAVPSGFEPISEIPVYNTTDLFGLFELPPDPGVMACHEATHYVQATQVAGFHGTLTWLLGPAYTPQVGLDSWFWEGLAVYYETKLQGGIGRLGSRYFEGVLAAGTAQTGIDTDLFHVANRTPLHGGPYLLGAFFIDWLVSHYGEEKLWEVVEQQGRGLMFPFNVEGRFKRVYGTPVSGLAKQFSLDLAQRYPAASRPASQQKLIPLGTDVRHAWSSAGLEAIVSQDVDSPTQLTIRRDDGTVVMQRALVDVLPPRKLVRASSAAISGLSFTADGTYLYFVAIDRGPIYQQSKLMRVDVARGSLDVVVEDLKGSGGSVSADGSRYLFSRAEADSYGLAYVDLQTKSAKWLRGPAPGVFYLWPRLSPDGSHVVASRTDRLGFWVEVLDAWDGHTIREVTPRSGFAITPDWAGNDRVIFSDATSGRMQAHVASLSGGPPQRVSSAPFLAIFPQSNGSSVRFMNREGWHWTLDSVSLPDPKSTTAVASGQATSPYPVTSIRGGRSSASRFVSAAVSNSMEARDATIRVQSDTPYSALDGLFVPQGRGPWFALRSTQSASVGLTTVGGDRLGLHRWGVGFAMDWVRGLPSAQVGYINSQLAPAEVRLDVAHYGSSESKDVDAYETIGALTLARTWYGSALLSTGLRYDRVSRSGAIGPNVVPGLDDHIRQYAGYLASFEYLAAETTPYTGPRRAFSVDATSTVFPKLLPDQRFAIVDPRLSVGWTLPVVWRVLIDTKLRGRYVGGASKDLSLLQIGGSGAASPSQGVTTDSLPTGSRDAGVLPPGLRFFEPLAGFEDLAHYDRGTAMGESAFRFPIIMDKGGLSSLRVLPSTFLRQIDLEAFGSGAYLMDLRNIVGAVGGRVTVLTAVWAAPIGIRFQLAQRLSDDEKPAFYITLVSQ